MDANEFISHLNSQLVDDLAKSGVLVEVVAGDDPRLDSQLLIKYDPNLSHERALSLIVESIKARKIVCTPFVLIGGLLMQAFVSKRPLDAYEEL
jgi:hypothetical protein